MGKHTVPRMYLRSFSIGGRREQIYHKMRGEEPKAIPIATAATSNIYTDEIEKRLASLEGESDGLLKQVISEGSIDGIGFEGRRSLAEFMHTMHLRTLRNLDEVIKYNHSEETRQRLASNFIDSDYQGNTQGVLLGLAEYARDNNVETNGLVNFLNGEVLLPDERDRRLELARIVVDHAVNANSKDFASESFNNIVFGLEHHDQSIDIIAHSPWVLLQAREGVEFITSDNPILRNHGVIQDKFELFMPISPKLGIYVSRIKPATHGTVYLSNQWVRHMNALVLRQSAIVFGASKAPLLATESKHLRLTKPRKPFVEETFVPVQYRSTL